MTLHIPRSYYLKQLPGIPTIRPFEALACGILLICTPWDDKEGLFQAGKDYLVAENPIMMRQMIARLAEDDEGRMRLAEHGLATIRVCHTCAHRAEELLSIYQQLSAGGS